MSETCSIDDAILKKQVESELKNAIRSEERKKNQKRKTLSDRSEPPKKKEKKSNFIPVTEAAINACREYFWTTPVYLPLVDKVALFSGLTNETLCFGAYPILLSPHQKKDGLSVPVEYILGVSKPAIILYGLRKVFEKIYPERSPMDYSQWDLYRFNRAYYTVKVEKASFNQDLLELQMVETKTFGGAKDPTTIHWLEENKLKRWNKIVTLETYFADKDVSKVKVPRIPSSKKPWPANHLNKVNEAVEKMKKDLLLATQDAKEELNKKKIAEAMKNLNDGSEEDNSSDDSDE